MRLGHGARKWLVVLPALVLAGSLLAGTAPAAQTGEDGGDKERGRGRGLYVTPTEVLRTAVLTDRREYAPGRPVIIQTRLINLGKPVTFVNLQEYDILVRDARTGAVAWQWSWQFHRRNVLPPHTTFGLGRWETRTNCVQWNQTDNNGRPVPPGLYQIEARIYPYTVSAPILIRDPGGYGRP